MPILNDTYTLKQAQDFASDYAQAILYIFDEDFNILVTHNVNGWNTNNTGTGAIAQAEFYDEGVATIERTGTAAVAHLNSNGFQLVLSLPELGVSSTDFVEGQISSGNFLAVSFPNGE